MISYKQVILILVIITASLNGADEQNITEIVEISKKEFQKIPSLIINEGGLSASFIHNLAKLLEGNKSISYINLNSSRIGDDNLKILLPVLQNLNQLSQLHLYDTALTDRGIIALCNSFMAKKPDSLMHIDLCQNSYGIESIKQIQALRIIIRN